MTTEPATTSHTQPELAKTITRTFSEGLASHYRDCMANWSTSHRKTLAFCRSELAAALREAKQAEALRAVWQRWHQYFDNLQEHLADISYVREEDDLADITRGWVEQFRTVIAAFPENTTLQLQAEDIAPSKDDPVAARLWKSNRRLRNRLTSKPDLRGLPLHDLCQYYLGHPASRLLVEEWEQFLHLAAGQLQACHRIMQSETLKFLLLEEAATVWNADSPDISGLLSDAAESLQEMDALIAALDAHIENHATIFDNHTTEICETFAAILRTAGTFAHPAYRFNPRRQQKQTQSLSHLFRIHRKKWREHFVAEKEDWHGDTALKQVQLDVGLAYLTMAASLVEKVHDQVMPPLKKAEANLAGVAGKFDPAATVDAAVLRKEMKTAHFALLRDLRRTLLPEITDAFVKAQFDQLINRFLFETQHTTRELPEKQTIFEKCDIENVPPESEVDVIPLKELFEHSLLASLQSKCQQLDKTIQRRFTKILNGFSELDQVVEFNLKAALDSLEEKGDTALAVQLFNEGIERAAERLQDYLSESEKLESETRAEVYAITHEFMLDVQELLDDEKLLELKLQLMRAKAREKLQQTRRRVWEYIKYALPRAWRWMRKFATGIYEQYLRIGKITGLVTTSSATQEQLFRFLTETRQRITDLPFIYQQLFENKPLTDERFFAGRDKELSLIKSDLEDWENDRYMSTIIVGEKGGGRTTLLNFAEKNVYKGYPISKVSLKETVHNEAEFLPLLAQLFPDLTGETMDDYETALKELEKKQVCIVENIQNLYIKTITGFELLNRFLRLVAHTQEQIYWVLSCTLYCWEYLEKVTQLSQQFQRVLLLGGLSRSDMENVILKRHRITGYELRFEVPESLRNSRQYRKLGNDEDRHVFLRNRFFEQLQEVSQGNISVAMLYWQRAISKIEENRLVLSASVDFDYSFIYQLSAPELFSLGALLQHESLSVKEHARIFHQSDQKSDTLMGVLRRKGIIIPAIGDDFILHPFLYRPTVRALKNNNILH